MTTLCLHNRGNYLEEIFLHQFCAEVNLKTLKDSEIKSFTTLTF